MTTYIDEFNNNNDNNNNNNNNIHNDELSYHPCSKKIMPSLFAWFLLISSSSAYFTMVLPIYIELIGVNRFYLFVAIIAFHLLLFIYVILNFTIATFMDPGRFPKQDVFITLNDEQIKLQTNGNYKNVLINDINVRMKWCTTCQFYRPPRSSHCGVCNACIDTMDHHCPWVSNCIARRNYKYFLFFLITLTIHMLIILSLCLVVVLLNKENLTQLPIMVSIFLIILTSLLLIPVGGLTGFHLVLVSRGRTTNEQVTGKFRTGVNPFDDGCIKNWKQILFSSLSPSYIQFRNRQAKKREYLETKLLLELRYKAKMNKQHLQDKDKIKYVSDQNLYNSQYVDSREKFKYKLNNMNSDNVTAKVLPQKYNQFQYQKRHQSEEPQTMTTTSTTTTTKFKSLNLKRPPSATTQSNANIWEDRKATNGPINNNNKHLSQHQRQNMLQQHLNNNNHQYSNKKEPLLLPSSSSSSYSSSNGSKYIRNNSYLNAHPVNIPIDLQTQQPLINSNTSNNRAKMNTQNHQQKRQFLKPKENLNNRARNNNNNTNKQNVLMPIEDYASYEITV